MKSYEWKLGLSSSFSNELNKNTFTQYAENGIRQMEISMPSEDYKTLEWEKIKKLASDTGVELWSFHLPFAPFDEYNIASFDKTLCKKTISVDNEYIKRASELGIKIAVIHPSGEPNQEKDRDELLKIAADSLAEIAEKAHDCGVTVAVEDLPRTCLGNCSSDILRLISDNDKLAVCFDTNHLLKEKNSDFIKAVGNKIVTVHISDYDFRNERHWLPYEGRTNWIELVELLENAGYSGPFMYEVSSASPASITRRDLTYSDIAENYKACVEKYPFKPFGIPNEEECVKNAFYKNPII